MRRKLKIIIVFFIPAVSIILVFMVMLSLFGINGAIGGAGELVSNNYKEKYGKEINWNDPNISKELDDLNLDIGASGAIEDTSKWTINKGYKNSQAYKLGFNLPVKNATITATAWYYPSSFGGGWHPGVDLATNSGKKIYAVADGQMIYRLNTVKGCGIYMGSVHQVGKDVYYFIYCHMSRQGTNNGKIKKGEVIGYVGSTGNSTGPHVHVEVFKLKNTTVDSVIKKYKKNRDVYFGLGYEGIGNCVNVCRFKPHEFFGLQFGQVF